jgi:trimethylamine--corrinoid protein Co-methyltransferase
MHAAILSGANYIWHVAGWLEAGLCCGYSKFATDTEQLAGWYKYAQGVSFDDFKEAMAAIGEGPAGTFPLHKAIMLEHFESVFHACWSWINSFEQCRRKRSNYHDARGRDKAPGCWRLKRSPHGARYC